MCARAELHDLLPSILPQLGADNMATLRKLAEEGYTPGAGGAPGGFGGMPGGGARPGVATIEEEDEDDGAHALYSFTPFADVDKSPFLSVATIEEGDEDDGACALLLTLAVPV